MRTALKEYQRLEAIGLWREAPEAQLREVIISFGHSTLALSNESTSKRGAIAFLG
ncbi:hypothetical protein [Halocynthiibacter sp.]|uniref:hypothetical protein n=1 Tax=Halocynthiibacter sp. TaxID=1979210 RepID=UPI003C39E048